MRQLFLLCLLAACSGHAAAPAAPSSQAATMTVAPAVPDRAPDVLKVVERSTTAVYADPKASSTRVVVIAELIGTRQRMPMCGYIHFGTVLDYRVVRVESGTLVGDRFVAAVGCIDMPRASYDTTAGTLDSFRSGELHRLVLSTDRADDRGMTFIEAEPAFVVVSADPTS
jgi:hypothetical protein